MFKIYLSILVLWAVTLYAGHYVTVTQHVSHIENIYTLYTIISVVYLLLIVATFTTWLFEEKTHA